MPASASKRQRRDVGQHSQPPPSCGVPRAMARRRQPPVGALRRRPASSILGDRAVGVRHSCCGAVSVTAKPRLLQTPHARKHADLRPKQQAASSKHAGTAAHRGAQPASRSSRRQPREAAQAEKAGAPWEVEQGQRERGNGPAKEPRELDGLALVCRLRSLSLSRVVASSWLAGCMHAHARRAAQASRRECVRTRPGLVV